MGEMTFIGVLLLFPLGYFILIAYQCHYHARHGRLDTCDCAACKFFGEEIKKG